jgi:DNA-binding IclR family transcriptional regulator
MSEEDLYHFLEEHGDDRVRGELLAFWGRHPNVKFGESAICYALDFSKSDVERALKTLVATGLVNTHIYKEVTLYSLTTNEERRRLVVGLGALSWDRLQLMLKRMERSARVVKCYYGEDGS